MVSDDKRGFTLAEAIVAIAVILIVSASAATVAVYSSRVEAKNESSFIADTVARNVVECFRYSKNNENISFADALSECGITSDGSENYRYANETGIYYISLNFTGGQTVITVTPKGADSPCCTLTYHEEISEGGDRP